MKETLQSLSSQNGRARPSWLGRTLFNLILLAVLGTVAYTVLTAASGITAPSIVTGTQVQVAARTSGTLERLYVTRNAPVQKGQVLATLRDETLEARIAGASAELAELQNSRLSAQSNESLALRLFSIREKIAELQGQLATQEVEVHAASRAVLDAQRTLEMREDALRRAEALYREGALTLPELESRRMATAQARATLEDLRDQQRRLSVQRRSMLGNISLYQEQLTNLQQEASDALTQIDLSLQRTRSELDTLLAQREQLTLRAETSGIVSDVAKNEGELVSAGETVLQISTGDEIWVEAYLDPSQRSAVSAGVPVDVVVDAAGRKRLPGQISGVLPVLRPFPGSGSVGGGLVPSDTRNYIVALVSFRQPEQAKLLVQPGQQVSTVIRARGRVRE